MVAEQLGLTTAVGGGTRRGKEKDKDKDKSPSRLRRMHVHTARKLSGKVRDELRRVPLLQTAKQDLEEKLVQAAKREDRLRVQMQRLQQQLGSQQRDVEVKRQGEQGGREVEMRRLQMEAAHWREQYRSALGPNTGDSYGPFNSATTSASAMTSPIKQRRPSMIESKTKATVKAKGVSSGGLWGDLDITHPRSKAGQNKSSAVPPAPKGRWNGTLNKRSPGFGSEGFGLNADGNHDMFVSSCFFSKFAISDFLVLRVGIPSKV